MSNILIPTTDPVEPAMSAASWSYADEWLDDSEQVRAARAKADELGVAPVSRATANLLTLLAASIGATTVVEVGTGAGVSGAALLRGMNDDGILTSIDIEAENQRVARETFTALGYDHVRTRLIAGRALDVLPRLTDQAYDIVFADGDKGEYPAILAQAARLLRTGGLVIFDQVLADGRVADSGKRDSETIALRDVVHALRDDDNWLPAMVTVGHGLLVAVLRSPID
jgi:predicted O-methyltransferase YrrM